MRLTVRGTSYDVRLTVRGTSVSVSVDGETVLEGTNPAQNPSGKIGFYTQGFAHLDVDDVTISLPRAS
ncbi:hypothetical protein ACGFJC_32835 [Nonomuraea fuscirosea]|uniref:hypothetical protein n=1 Tax=Nonomuraea fuscirosea TaxID=1291556 RepID=UPI003719D082